MNEDQINELKSLVDELTTQGLSTEEIQSRVDQRKAEFAETVEVTEEIQTDSEGKTNGAVETDAAVAPTPEIASESTESEPDDILSGLEEINDTREIDRRIKIIAGDDMQIDALDSPKRIHQYNSLIGKKNKIQKQAVSDIEKLPTPDRIIESFDVDKPAIKGESYVTDQGGVYIASSPLVVDGEVVGSQAQPVSLEEVEVIAPRLSVEELSEKYNSFTKNIVRDVIDVLALSTEILPVQTEATKAVKKASEAAKDRREQYNRLYQEGKIDLNATRSAYNTISNSLRTMANLDDQFEYIWYLAGTQGVDEETRQKNLKKLSEARRKLNLKETYYLPTQRFDRLKEKEGVLEYALGGVAGIFDAASAVGTSFAQTPAGLFINIAAGNIKENNEINAERLGLSVDEYIESGQADFTVPIVTTALELGSEWLKLGQISKAINRMPIGRQKKIAQTMQVFGGNGAQEMFQYSLSQYNKYSAEGLNAEDATRKSIVDFFSPESFEQGLKGSFGGTAVAVGGQALKASAAIKTPSENNRIQNDINRLYELDKAKYSKNITPEQLKSINTAQAEIKKSLTQQVDANEVLVASLTDKQLETINQNYDLLTSINAEAQATQEATNLTQEQKQAILEGLDAAKKQASQEIYDVRNEGEAFVNELRKAREAVEPLSDVEILDFENTEQVKDFIQKQDKDLDTKASEEQAFVIQNPETGKQTVVINRGVAAKEAIRHEVGHVLLYQTVKDSPETAINLGSALLNELNKIDPAQVKDSNFKKRIEQYADSTRAVQMEEAVTLFSDAINTGDIKFNENIFTKLGDRVRRAMQKFGVNIKFDSGRDVYNFVKDYNKSLEKGGLSLAQVQAATKGVEGELVTPAEQQADEQIIKESRSEEASNRVQEIYDEQGEAGAFDIIEQFKPITSRIVERRSEAPGFDRQLLTDEIETGQRGIIDLIKEYDPESGVPLAAYINKFLPARAIEASKRVLGEEFTEDVAEARGVAAEEVAITETPTKPEAKAIDPFRIMPDIKETATAEVQKSIADKDVDVTTVTYKELKDVAPYQTVADFFNVPVSRIKNPKDNLRKSDDVANIQRWILKNEPTLKNLFTEANRDVVEVTEGNKVIRQGGEPTAIPRNLLNKFYTKGDRVGNNFQWKLKPYDRTTFLEAVGIKDGKVDPNFTPRAAEAQTIKGILDMYTRNLGNVAARDIIEGREDIVPAEKARVKAEVAKGKPRLMFSKQGLLDVTQARDINKVLKILGMDSASVPDSKRADIQKAFEDAIKKYKFTTNVFLAGAFAFSGAKYKRKADGNVYYELTNGKEIIGLARRDSEGNIRRNKNGKKLFDQPTAEQVVEQFGKGVKLLPGKGRLYYGVNDPAYQTALAEANKNSEGKNQGKAKRVNINAVNTDKGKAQAKINMQVLEDVVSQLDTAIKNGMPKELAAMVIAQGYQATTGLIKIAAPFKYFSKNLQYGISLKQKTGDKFREEHNPPASVVGASIIYGFATNNTSQIMADIKKNYYQTKLSKADDQKLDDAKLDATLPVGTTIADNPAIRFIEAGIDLNSIINYETGQTMAEELGVSLNSSDVNVQTVFEQNKILKEVLSEDITAKTGQDRLNEITKLKSIPKASVGNNNENNTIKFSKQVPNEEVLDNLSNADQAMANARNADALVKKIRVFDFDDTLARSNSNVLYEMPDGTTGKLNATQFAERAGELEAQGAEFDFSEFSKVVDGKRGPVFKAIENIVKARGAEDVFILTARPADAAGPIKEFMDALGVNLPIENIVGLGDGKAEAKARWMTGKAAEGYNDFFFVDDAYKNVKAVQDALDVFDVKSKTQQAKVKFSKKADLDKGFNDILQQTTGIASEKEYKRVKAEVAGASRGMAIRGIPYSAQDFVGLLYETLGKGDLGDRQMAWYKTHVLNPYGRAMNDIDNARLAMMNDYKELKKQLGLVPKNLRKKIPGEPFTNEQAVRVYIWNKQGMEVPGISKSDLKDLTEYVENNAELQVFADQLIAIQKGDDYAKPKQGWPAGSITTDLLESINTVKRAKYLEQWQENVDVIFSEKNMNKLEAAYGKKYRVALENMLERMKTGRNRRFSDDSLTGRFTDWLQGSIGTIMFFNTRSALLQTISSINFVNFTDNNPFAAAKAFANQKQYWSDFVKLINSDFLKARRSGLRMNVNEADIADMAKKGGPRAVINKLLQLGFAPTQIADSFAIASGGATFYRNRINTYKKQGLSQQEAETKAFEDFRENAEESQQSARPDRISMQQAGGLGRLILAFQNTPSQYARIIDKSIRDLKNGRGDAKTNISKIIYYSTVQNLLFNALQQALFAFAFGDEEPEDKEKEKKYVDIANSMMDSLLRGTGIAGGVLSVGKNAILRIVRESEKARPNYEKVGADLIKIAPPISSKLSKINQAARSYKWDKEEMKEKGWSLDNPAYLASANVIAALTNIPLDRAVKKTNNVVQATSQDLETWERLALLGGWQDWEIGIDEENKTNKPQPRKSTSKYKKSKIK